MSYLLKSPELFKISFAAHELNVISHGGLGGEEASCFGIRGRAVPWIPPPVRP